MREYQTGLYKTIGDYAYAKGISDTYASNKSSSGNGSSKNRYKNNDNSANSDNVGIEDYLNKDLEYEEVIELLKLVGRDYNGSEKIKIKNLNSLVRSDELVNLDKLCKSIRNFYYVYNSEHLYDDIEYKTHNELPLIYLKNLFGYLNPSLENDFKNINNFKGMSIKISDILSVKKILSNKDNILKLDSKTNQRIMYKFLDNTFDGKYSNEKLRIPYIFKTICKSIFLNMFDDDLKALFFKTIFFDVSNNNSFLFNYRGLNETKINDVIYNLSSYINDIESLFLYRGYKVDVIKNNKSLRFSSKNENDCYIVKMLAKGGLTDKANSDMIKLKTLLDIKLFSITCMYDEKNDDDNLRVIRLKEMYDNLLNRQFNNNNLDKNRFIMVFLEKSNSGVNYLNVVFKNETFLIHPKFIIKKDTGVFYNSKELSLNNFIENSKNLIRLNYIPQELTDLFKLSSRAFDLRKSTNMSMMNRLFNR